MRSLNKLVKEWTDDVPHAFMKVGAELLDEIQRTFAKAFLNVTPPERQHSPAVSIPTLLRGPGVPIGSVAGRFKRVEIRFPVRDNRHKVVLGASGAGKTEWAKNYVVNRPGGVAYLDNTDGEAVEDILKALPEERLERTVLLDHSDKQTPLTAGVWLNTGDPFAEDAATGQWVQFFTSNFGIEDAWMTQEIIAYACKATFAVPGNTLLDAARMVQSEDFRAWVLQRLDPWRYQDVLAWWNRFEQLSDGQKNNVAAAFLRRVGVIFRDRTLRLTLGQVPPRPLEYRKWMDEGYTVLIRAPEGLGRLAVRTIAALHVLGFWQAALSREDVPQAQRQPFMVIADEPQTWLARNEDALDDMFSKARKYGLGLMCLFQSTKQVTKESPALLRVMLDNTPDLLVFRTSRDQLDLAPFDPEAIPRYHFVAQIYDSPRLMVKSLGKLQPVRHSVDPFVKAARRTWNQDWQVVENAIQRRERVCVNAWNDPQSGSRKTGSAPTATLDSPPEIEKSSNSFLIIE